MKSLPKSRKQPAPRGSADVDVTPPYQQAKRVKLRHGGLTRRLLLVAPPFPEVGEVLKIDGHDWTVEQSRDEKILAAFERDGGKLRQVYP